MRTAPRVSVVLISRNQSWNITRLIDSVREAAPDADCALVDSASTDETAKLASSAGVRVAQLGHGQHLSPSAGRAIGFSLVSGDFVLFLDGDATVVTGWLELALDVLDRAPEVAVVTGSRIVVPIASLARGPLTPPDHVVFDDVTRCGGSALYRASVLREVGGFDPWLYSEEEPELALRIRSAGYRLMRSSYPIIIDRTDDPDRAATVLARRRRNLYFGTGQVLRKHWGTPIAQVYARERKKDLLAVGGGVAYVLAIPLIAVFGDLKLAVAIAAGLPLAALLGLFIRSRDFERVKLSTVRIACHVEGTIRGFLMRPSAVEDYSPRYTLIDPVQGR